jgi:D-alanyl-D-alanine carboxypeptidase
MFSFLISLIIASQLVLPIEGAVLGANNLDDSWPKRKLTNSFGPIINSESALVMDKESGKILFQKNGFTVRSIASISKLLTAIVFLEQEPNFEKSVILPEGGKNDSGRIEIGENEAVNLKDLFRIMLVGSINSAAEALASATKLSYAEFIQQMNIKAKELGMKDSYFKDPTGLSAENRATAKDVATLLREALKNSLIEETVVMDSYSFASLNNKWHQVKNTNKLLGSYLEVVGGKTGYIEESGYCLANLVKNKEAQEGIIVVILGAKSEEERFQENKFLSQWVFDNWSWNAN